MSAADEDPKLPSTVAPSGKNTVLVVEDEVLIRLMLAQELRDLGCIILEAANADQAIAILASRGDIDLVLTDIEMPGAMNGIDLARKVNGIDLARKVRAGFPSVKVAIASAHAHSVDRELNVEATFMKPYDFSQLVVTVEALLG